MPKKVTRGKRNRKDLTDDNVLTLPTKRKQYMVWDKGLKGLHVLVSPGGARTYRTLYYFVGSSKPHSRSLGRVGVLPLDKAREQCLADQKAAKEGLDPKRDQPSRSDSFETLVNEYIDREQIGRKGNETAEETRRNLLKAGNALLDRPIASIRIDEIDHLLERIRDGDAEQRGRPYLAVKLWTQLGSFFRWCVKKRKLAVSPMGAIDKPWEGGKPRDRVFSDAELKKLWNCDKRSVVAKNRATVKLSPVEAAFLKLLILTGKRRGKVGAGDIKRGLTSMRWGEIGDNWDWTPQPGKKNKRMHALPLPKLAQRILLGVKPKDAQPDDLVFPEISWQFQERVKTLSGIPDFMPHAIRHTAETKTAELGVPPHIRDRLFDHASQRGSGKGYDHWDYRPEMAQAMELWADYIERIAMPEGVKALR